jgi:hypothetical protein
LGRSYLFYWVAACSKFVAPSLGLYVYHDLFHSQQHLPLCSLDSGYRHSSEIDSREIGFISPSRWGGPVRKVNGSLSVRLSRSSALRLFPSQ